MIYRRNDKEDKKTTKKQKNPEQTPWNFVKNLIFDLGRKQMVACVTLLGYAFKMCWVKNEM